ncbi:hypothetical protein A2U01_0002042 [Trifolium medium]|uniref:Uncharacterized protein n=1 Tax=Trifolium medium TaxID=97028 RepID=A0A392M2N6_9FABA|nr:hypothetical protein [Trifolium medium]
MRTVLAGDILQLPCLQPMLIIVWGQHLLCMFQYRSGVLRMISSIKDPIFSFSHPSKSLIISYNDLPCLCIFILWQHLPWLVYCCSGDHEIVLEVYNLAVVRKYGNWEDIHDKVSSGQRFNILGCIWNWSLQVDKERFGSTCLSLFRDAI